MESHANWTELFTAELASADGAVSNELANQREQNERTVNLVASESYCPRATLEAEASVLVNKNASGYPPRVSMGGSDHMNAIERLAADRALALFGGEHANVQPLSSTVANVAVLRALLRPGDRILAFDQQAGGHNSHGGRKHVSGQDYEIAVFGIDESTGHLDWAGTERLAEEFRPKMIVAGSSNFPLAIDFARLKAIADRVGALLFADVAHVSGLIAAGLHQNPVPFCDVVTTSTHKTLCGPRTGGLILCRKKFAAEIDAAIAPGLQAAPGGHIIAGRAVLFDLVGRPAFGTLMQAVVDNARALADSLSAASVPLYAGGTDTHMVVVDLRGRERDQATLNRHLLRHGIVANTATLPATPGKPGRLGLRLGSTAMSIRGAGPQAFGEIGRLLAALLETSPDAADDISIASRLEELAAEYPIPFQ